MTALLPRQFNEEGLYGLEWLPISLAPMGLPLLVYSSKWHEGAGCTAMGLRSIEGWVLRGLFMDGDAVEGTPEAWAPMPPGPGRKLTMKDSPAYGGALAC